MAALCTTQTANAFYNPQAGRWLNRDPIEERGGINLYAAAANDLLARVDPLGKQGCTCGPDVTDPVKNVLQDIQSHWDQWDFDQRETSCNALLDPATRKGAWFIVKLADAGVKSRRTGNYYFPFGEPAKRGSCGGTVWFNGACAHASDVQYLMFGKLFQLCNDVNPIKFNLVTLLGAVRIWKCLLHDECDFYESAAYFAQQGYGATPYKPYPKTYILCGQNPDSRVEEKLDWQWFPMHVRIK
jgi:hypothetical protein